MAHTSKKMRSIFTDRSESIAIYPCTPKPIWLLPSQNAPGQLKKKINIHVTVDQFGSLKRLQTEKRTNSHNLKIWVAVAFLTLKKDVFFFHFISIIIK